MDRFFLTPRRCLIAVLLTLAHASALAADTSSKTLRIERPSAVVSENGFANIACVLDSDGTVQISGTVTNTGKANGGPFPVTGVLATIIGNLASFFTNMSADRGEWSTDSESVSLSIGAMAADEKVDFVVTATDMPSGEYELNFELAQNEFNPSNPNTSCSVTVPEQAAKSADLAIEKTATRFGFDEEVQYTLTITNNGPDDANATVEDELPEGVEYMAYDDFGLAECVVREGSNTVVCHFPSIAAGDSRAIIIETRRRSSGTTTNTASVISDVPDPVPSNNEATDGLPELRIENTCVFDPVAERVEISGTVSNTDEEYGGPFEATGVFAIITGPLVGYFTNMSADRGEWSTDNESASLDIGTMGANDKVDFVVTATGMPSGEYELDFEIEQNENPGDPGGNCSVTVPEQAEKSADLAIEKTAEDVGFDELIYTLTITNNGPDDANATIEDELPAGVEYTSHETSDDAQCVARDGSNTVVCFYPGLAAGDSRTLTIRTRKRTSGTTTNTASVVSDLPDPVPSNNEATAAIPGIPDLHVSKTVASVRGTIGNEVTYTILVENTGGAPATDVTVTDIYLGANLEYIAANHPSCEDYSGVLSYLPDAHSLVCLIGDLGAGESFSIEVTFLLKRYQDEIKNLVDVIIDEVTVARDSVTFAPSDYIADVWFSNLGSPLPAGQKHAADDAFDVYIDSIKVVDDVAPGTAIRLKSLLTNISPIVHLVPSGSEDLADAVFTDSVDFFTGTIAGDDFHLPDSYTLVFVGPQNDLRLLLRRDARVESEDPAHADFLLVHAAPDAQPVLLRLLDETSEHAATETLAETLAYAEMTGYHSLAAAAYNVEVADAASGAQIEVFRLDLNEAAGKVLMLALASDDSGQLALLALDAEGNRQDGAVVTAADDDAALPLEYVLYSNYPNPFNPSTMIRYDLPERSAVRLEVFDALGRLIRTLVEVEQSPGTYSVDWDGRDAAGSPVASGTYLYRITTATFSAGRSMMLIK